MIFDYEFDKKIHWETKYIVYLVTNLISRKFYIGQTVRMLSKRWEEYENELLKPVEIEKRRKCNIKLKYSTQKYFKETGNTDFLYFSILEIIDIELTEVEKLNILNEREIFFINEYRKKYGEENIYNIKDGGGQTSGSNLSKGIKEFYKTEKGEELKTQMSEKMTGKSYEELFGKEKAEQIKKKIGKSSKERNSGENHPMFGKQHSDETKNKIRKARLGSHANEETKKKKSESMMGKNLGKNSSNMKIYDLSETPLISSSGEIFTKIECLNEFCRKHDLDATCMIRLLKGKVKSHKNWKIQR